MTPYLLHNIGPKPTGAAASNYNTREEIQRASGLLTFDGIYLNVWENRDLLRTRPSILFVMGDYVGEDNRFDHPMPLEEYCDWWHLTELVANYGCKLGWHTWTHKNLCKLSDDEVLEEVTPPFPMDYFAYPYGDVDQRVANIVQKAGYKAAYSVFQGDGSQFQLNRRYL